MTAENAARLVEALSPISFEGRVSSVSGLGIKIADRFGVLKIADRILVERTGDWLASEIIAIEKGAALAMPFGTTDGVRCGARAKFSQEDGGPLVSDAWLGRVVDALGRPIDEKGDIPAAPASSASPLDAMTPMLRARLGPPVDFGVKAITAFTPCRRGQRIGLFSGAGVGKSTLLSTIARNTDCDVAVIALIGERGREVREFVEDALGPAQLARSVVIAATSDEPALIRREAANLAFAVAEHFRDGGRNVLFVLDSLTRVAAAQREIGLAAGEPPTAKGYPPSVFALFPRLLERAGPGRDGPRPGFVTGVFSVLVEGDDLTDPIADAAKSLLDGHVVLSRRIAEAGRRPAIDILKSISRAADGVLPEAAAQAAAKLRASASVYEEFRDMISIGAYRRGARPDVDRSIEFAPHLEEFLNQTCEDVWDFDRCCAELERLGKAIEAQE